MYKYIDKMTVGGFIENYVEKHMLLDLINFIRKEFGYSEINKEYQNYFSKYNWGKYVLMSNEQFEDMKQEDEKRRNSINKNFLI